MKRTILLVVLSALSALAGNWGKEETYSISSKDVKDCGFLSISRNLNYAGFALYTVTVRISKWYDRGHLDVSGKPYLNGNFPALVDISFDDALEFAQTWQADVQNITVYASQPEALITAIRKAKKLKLVIRHDSIAGQYEFDVADLPEWQFAAAQNHQ